MRGLTLALAVLAAGGAHAGELTVTLLGAGPTGAVRVGLFADAAGFPQHAKPLAAAAAEPQGGRAVVRFPDLKPGRYAIAAFQDAKGTGAMVSNFLGMPLEPYGFSNDANGGLRAPSFDAAAFEVGSDALALVIHLH